MRISNEGTCVSEYDCIPTKYNPTQRNIKRRELQQKFLSDHKCFVSCGRLYVQLEKFIVDAVTGTLYRLSGHCVSAEAVLFVDLNDKNDDPVYVHQFVMGNY